MKALIDRAAMAADIVHKQILPLAVSEAMTTPDDREVIDILRDWLGRVAADAETIGRLAESEFDERYERETNRERR